MNFKYLDENGKYVDGEILYQTMIDGKVYVICNLHYGENNNSICACKEVIDENGQRYVALDESDNIEAIETQLEKIMKGEN